MHLAREAIAIVSSLSVSYQPEGGRPVHALDQATLAVHAGERLGILGESGSGKSTLAVALMRLLPAHACRESGSVRFLEHDIFSLPETVLRRIRGAEIALIPQDPAQALNPAMVVGDQIAEVLRAHVPMTRRDRSARVKDLLAEVGFDHPADIYRTYPHELSGGQRQRVVIAQAVACRPSLVIADEPTSKLDASLQAEVLSLMRGLSERHGIAFVLITHDPTVLTGVVDRTAVMYAGRIVEEGSTEMIFRNPFHPYTQALIRLSARHLMRTLPRMRLPAIEGEPPDLTEGPRGCPFAPRCPEKTQACTESDPRATETQPFHRVSCLKYGE
jgi:oligopeptide/dipeptide ABC transporter ATP-binding protein